MPLSKSRLVCSIMYASSAIACMQTMVFSAPLAPAIIQAPQSNSGQAFVVNEPITPKDPNNPIAVPLYIAGVTPVVTTGINTYIGPTTIGANQTGETTGIYYNMGQAGTAEQSITVNTNGFFLGSGTTVGNITNKGILSPGNNSTTTFTNEPSLSIGTTMNITGSLTQTSTGTTKLYFTPTMGDKINLSGTANLGSGSIHITPMSGFYDPLNPPTFTAITWGAYSGATPTIIITTANPNSLDYLPITVTPTITPTGLSLRITSNDVLNADQVTNISALTSAASTIQAPNGTTLSATEGASHTITQPITFIGASSAIISASNSTTNFSGALSGASTLNVSGSGTTVFGANNTGLTGAINVTGSTVNISNGASLGTGVLNLSGAGTTLNLGSASGNAVTLLNPVSLTDTANPVTMVVPAGASATLSEPITGATGTTLNMSGGGATTISSANPSFAGNMSVSNSTVSLASGADLGSGSLALTGATVNLMGGASLNNAVTTNTSTVIAMNPRTNTTTTVGGSLSGAGTINMSGGGTVLFTGINTGLTGPVNVTGSTVQIANNANLGTGTLSVNSGTISMGAVALPNPVSITAASTFTSNAASGTTSTLSGAITGSAPLTFNGTGKTNLTATGTSAYAGTLNVSGGILAINSPMPAASVNVTSGATLSGAGTIGGLIQSGGIKPGNSIGTLTIDGNYTTADGAIYNVEINSAQPSVADALAPRSSQIVVTGNTTLSDTYTINVLMDAGFYPAGVVDYAILTSAGTLDVNAINLQWNTQPGLTFTVGTLADSGTDGDGHSLMLRYIATQGFTVGSDQTAVDTTTLGVTYNSTAFDNPTLTPSTNDVFATNSGLAPVADHPEFTDIVFQNNQPAGSDGSSDDDVTTTATTDNFRFKGFKSKKPTASVGKKGALESLLNAISENGPVSYQKNETRIWMTPYANRSRTSMTNSNAGNQGWSGGSLMGIEQRNAKDTWSIGLMTGLMGSHSHTLGQPNTFSKTKGVLFGLSNAYKYTDYKDAGNFGHEIFASRVTTFVDSQRYGLSTVDNTTPFYALASYKTTTDIMNAQLNYLFNVIPKSVTCRLNFGATYHDVKTGKIDERNAGMNGITTAASSAQSTQVYGGIGFRKSFKYDAIAIRTTAVYEYGYQVSSTGSPIVKTTQSAAPTTFTDTVGPRQNKHYVQLNSSYADKDSGLKFSLSYSGVFYKNVATHTGMLKVAYQF